MANILIVDDANLIRYNGSSAVQEAGHKPFTAMNGQEGLDIINNNKIDLIFSDINMPVMNGFDMISKIKSNEEYKFIPIVMLTTESSPELKQKAKDLGVNAWIIKPFNKDKFLLTIEKLLTN